MRDLRQEPAVFSTVYYRPIQGLGDWVEGWAKPIGCWLDRRTAKWKYKTALCGCSACSRRRRFLNIIVPNCRAYAGGWKGCFLRIVPAWYVIYRPASAPAVKGFFLGAYINRNPPKDP